MLRRRISASLCTAVVALGMIAALTWPINLKQVGLRVPSRDLMRQIPPIEDLLVVYEIKGADCCSLHVPRDFAEDFIARTIAVFRRTYPNARKAYAVDDPILGQWIALVSFDSPIDLTCHRQPTERWPCMVEVILYRMMADDAVDWVCLSTKSFYDSPEAILERADGMIAATVDVLERARREGGGAPIP